MIEVKENSNGKHDLFLNGELVHSFNNADLANGSKQLLWKDMSVQEARMTLRFSGQLKADS